VRGFVDTVTVDGEGHVSGMSDAIERLLDRYPWLTDDVPDLIDKDSNGDRPMVTGRHPRRPGCRISPRSANFTELHHR
jgi:hypothetical protein